MSWYSFWLIFPRQDLSGLEFGGVVPQASDRKQFFHLSVADSMVDPNQISAPNTVNFSPFKLCGYMMQLHEKV